MHNLREVSDHVTASRVVLCHDIEEKRLHCKVESFVFEEEFGHETEALAVDLVLLSVHFKHRRLPTSVDLSARWVTPRTQTLGTHNIEDHVIC